ncbi:PKD domain-containing protein [Candidatus Woesearchaeota archaeon]|nr:PKD domain-containing protein [Candidatus Woesearchaeota archaeon]
MKKEIIFALMAISILLISACDVYNTLYVKQAEDAEGVSDEEIIVEGLDEKIIEEAVGGEEIDAGIAKKEVLEDATVLIVKETEVVNIVPNAEDPDKDKLTFTFTSPLDENGQWKTTYGNAGEYTVTVTASDGSLTASKEVLIIVNRKEEAPTLDSFTPEETAITIDETNQVAFSVRASDLNDDILRYSWKLDGVSIGDDDSVEYKTTYEDSGSHTVKAVISDGIFDAEKIWSVTVNNVNRKPQIAEIGDIKAKETDTVAIEVQALDDDEDEISYSIDDSRFVQEDGGTFRWETSYDDAGKHLVTISVSDGVDTASQEVTVNIENVNRPPVILDIRQK